MENNTSRFGCGDGTEFFIFIVKILARTKQRHIMKYKIHFERKQPRLTYGTDLRLAQNKMFVNWWWVYS